jgi:hypothetical protein
MRATVFVSLCVCRGIPAAVKVMQLPVSFEDEQPAGEGQG